MLSPYSIRTLYPQNVTKLKKKESEYESELFVGGHCKIRVDPLSRAISVDDLSTRLRRFTFVSLINLPLKLQSKCVTSKQFVLIGVLSSKEIKISKNQNKYLMLKLDDFKANVSCFIFNADAISKFCKIQEGTVLVLASPTIMNERNNNNTSNHSNGLNGSGTGSGSFGQRNINNNHHQQQTISLKIEDFEQVLVIGRSLDFGFCPKTEGHRRIPCRNVINKATHDLCEYHKAQQYKKYASKRNDTNRTSMSRLRVSTKKSLSGPSNGISMVQRRHRQQMASRSMYNDEDSGYRQRGGRQSKRPNVDYKAQRERNRAMLMESSGMTSGLRRRMQKYGTGGKNILQIEQNKKKKEMDRLLKGKALLPHLGSNWGSSNGNGMKIVFEPRKEVKVTSNGSNQVRSSRVKRKRSFKEMEEDGRNDEDEDENENDKENANPEMIPSKRIKLSDPMMSTKSKMVELVGDEPDDESKVEVSSVMVAVYICKYKKCALRDKASETLNTFCRQHRQNVAVSRGRKYFWKCTDCGNKIQFRIYQRLSLSLSRSSSLSLFASSV